MDPVFYLAARPRTASRTEGDIDAFYTRHGFDAGRLGRWLGRLAAPRPGRFVVGRTTG